MGVGDLFDPVTVADGDALAEGEGLAVGVGEGFGALSADEATRKVESRK
ncbi:MAG: hypothetical protein V7609_791 [Verrucomicrobiota bacterium]